MAINHSFANIIHWQFLKGLWRNVNEMLIAKKHIKGYEAMATMVFGPKHETYKAKYRIH